MTIWTIILITFYAMIGASQQILKFQLLKSLCVEYFLTSHVVVLTDNNSVAAHFQWSKTLSKLGISSTVWSNSKLTQRFNSGIGSQLPILVVLDLNGPSMQPPVWGKLSDKWVIFKEENDISIETWHLPYNYKCVTIENKEHFFEVSEIYRIKEGSPLRHISLGNWSKQTSSLETSSVSFWQRRFDFQGTQLTYLITYFDPCNPLTLAAWNLFLCVQFSVWRAIEGKLNISSIPMLSTGREPLYLSSKFKTGAVDISINGWALNAEQMRIISYLWPTFVSVVDGFASTPGMEIGWGHYLMPLSNSIWKVILAWIVICTFAIFVLQKVTTRCETFFNRKTYGCHQEQVWTPLFAFLGQGSSEPAESKRERLLVLLAFMVPAVLVPAYSANLTAWLAIQTPQAPIKYLDDLLDHKEYTFGSVKTFPYKGLFPGNGTLAKYIRAVGLSADKGPVDEAAGTKMMCAEKFLYVSTTYLIAEQKPVCQYYKLKKPYAIFYQSLTLPKGSPYKTAFDFVVRNIVYSGVLSMMKSRVYVGSIPRAQETELDPVTVEEVAVLLAFLAIVIVLSFTMLLMEQCVYKVNKKSGKTFKIYAA